MRKYLDEQAKGFFVEQLRRDPCPHVRGGDEQEAVRGPTSPNPNPNPIPNPYEYLLAYLGGHLRVVRVRAGRRHLPRRAPRRHRAGDGGQVRLVRVRVRVRVRVSPNQQEMVGRWGRLTLTRTPTLTPAPTLTVAPTLTLALTLALILT